MATLGQLGVNGLLAVNQWIGMINSNLMSSSRTAYKATRPSFRDGTVTSLGKNIAIPSPTLNVQATTIEWGQGAIINSPFHTHFALSGQGFFVVTDPAGKYYLTRDGEFHWDGNGYLVNSSGLRVVSSGQDFIRMGRGDASDIFDPQGESVELKRFGDKSFLVVDVANRDGLRFSAYGSTVFELDGDLPLRVQNNLSSSMDGLTFLYRDPKQRTYVDAPVYSPFAPAGPLGSDFAINLGGNGVFQFRNFNPLGVGIDFDPATNTIQDVITAINAYRVANNISASNLTATFDVNSDRLKITNIPEPKIVNPGFVAGNFAIDFGNNGLFTYHGFSPGGTSIQSIVNAINAFATFNNVNVTASYNVAASTFTLTNTVAGNNEITFDGSNGLAMATFMKMPLSTASTGGGLRTVTSSANIDRNPPSTIPFTDIGASDLSMPLDRLIRPDSSISFTDANGAPLAEFFRLGYSKQLLFDPLTGFTGSEIESSRTINNTDVLSGNTVADHNLDISPPEVPVRSFIYYTQTTDITTPPFDFSGPPPIYFHDRANSRVISDGTANAGHGLIAIGQAQVTDAFEMVLDYHTDSALLELNFGYDKAEQIDSGGFTLFYNPATGDLNLALRNRDPNDGPVIIDTRLAALPTSSGLGGLSHRLAMTVGRDGILTISIDGSAAQVYNLAGFSQQRSGYLSIGHQGNRLEIDNLYADFKGKQNLLATGELISVGNTPYASSEIRASYQDRERTRVQQSALESSTSSLTEYVPMLALAQKLFASISKIISVSASLDDDINSLIR